LDIDCIFVVGHPDDGHRHYQNMLVKNNNVNENIYKCACVGLSHEYKTNCTSVRDCYKSLMKHAKQQD
jgi:hypothetical protein